MLLNWHLITRNGHGMKRIGLAHTLKLEINKMTYEEKLAFVEEHLGEECEFGFSTFTSSKLCGLTTDGFFVDKNGQKTEFCHPAPRKKLIPWTLETAESVQLRHKTSGIKVWMNYGLMIAWYHDSQFKNTTTYGRLLTDWETVDGKPCGAEVTE